MNTEFRIGEKIIANTGANEIVAIITEVIGDSSYAIATKHSYVVSRDQMRKLPRHLFIHPLGNFNPDFTDN